MTTVCGTIIAAALTVTLLGALAWDYTHTTGTGPK